MITNLDYFYSFFNFININRTIYFKNKRSIYISIFPFYGLWVCFIVLVRKLNKLKKKIFILLFLKVRSNTTPRL
jgi:hypothetical protein